MVNAFLAYLRSEVNRTPQTVTTYQTCLEELENYLHEHDENLTWTNLDEDVVRDWMVDLMERGNTARTVCKKLSALKSFYRYLLRSGVVAKDPTRLLQGPKRTSHCLSS